MNMPVRVVVVGAGRMGAEIAYSFLRGGSQVEIRDVDDARVGRGRDAVLRSIERGLAVENIAGSMESMVARLDTTVGLSDFGVADLVVEALADNLGLKRSVLKQISERNPPSTVVASSMRNILLADLVTAVIDPTRFIGIRFNGTPESKLVEVVVLDPTADEVVGAVVSWVSGIEMQSIVVRDSPGFVTSRLGVILGLEAIRLFEERVAAPEAIDLGMTLGYGLPIGPLRLTDIVGLDVGLATAEYLETTVGPRFSPPALLREMVSAGHLGRKTGQGFYSWREGS